MSQLGSENREGHDELAGEREQERLESAQMVPVSEATGKIQLTHARPEVSTNDRSTTSPGVLETSTLLRSVDMVAGGKASRTRPDASEYESDSQAFPSGPPMMSRSVSASPVPEKHRTATAIQPASETRLRARVAFIMRNCLHYAVRMIGVASMRGC